MSMAVGSKLQLEPGSWLEALYDVCIGTIVGANHFIYICSKWWYVHLVLPFLNLFGIRLGEDKEIKSKDGEKTFKVVGVGYGRTGTYSLTLALEELGFPTLHTQHLYYHDSIIGMWDNDVFLPAIEAQEALMGHPNLQLIADTGYQATSDLPMSLYYEQVMEEYPDCKFILTTRENSEVWFRSWETLTKSITQPTLLGGLFVKSGLMYSHYLRWLFARINKDNDFLTAPFPLPDQNKEAAIAGYKEHNRRVRETIPADRLLEYSVKEGWEPLCNFLEIADCPQTPFPKTNSGRSVQVQAISAIITPLILVLFVLFTAFALFFRKVTGMTVVQWASWKSQELKMLMRKILLGQHEKMAKSISPGKKPLGGRKTT